MKQEYLDAKLERYRQKEIYPFHMPGHKRKEHALMDPYSMDITEIEGFDNLHEPEGILLEGKERLAELYGAKESFFLVNGSTCGLLAAISAATRRGDTVLMARNCHKAVYHAVELSELKTEYLYPSITKEGIQGSIHPKDVEEALQKHPEIKAVILTSPTYDGVLSDIRTIAGMVHEKNIPLIVDEAHGAHLGFSESFPASAVSEGADVVIQSFHKTLPALTQTAVLHVCSDRVNVGKIKRFMGIYQTSSPSYILMASMDACMDRMNHTTGKKMFAEFTSQLEETRQRLMKCGHIRLITLEMINSTGVYDFDRSKLLFSTVGTSINGTELHRRLRNEFHIEMEMEAEKYVLGIASVGDTKEGLDRLCKAIEYIDTQVETVQEKTEKNVSYAKMKAFLTISQAMDAPQKRVYLEESVGKISGEFAYLYPPGIPVIVPGEQITGQFVRNMRRYMEQGLELQGLSDSSNETICAVIDSPVKE